MLKNGCFIECKMDLSILVPSPEQTVYERYDSLLELGVHFRSYQKPLDDDEVVSALRVLDEIKAEFRIPLLSPSFSTENKEREHKFKNGGVERVIGTIPSSVKAGRLYDDMIKLMLKLEIPIFQEKPLTEKFKELYGEIIFLDKGLGPQKLDEEETPRAGYFVFPGKKYLEQN